MPSFKFLVTNSVAIASTWALAAPQNRLSVGQVFDVQGHRGSRGQAIENTLPAFAWGLIDSVRTLELDNGLTEDGVVVVWHDESIPAAKCKDTAPVRAGDPQFPYVGKLIANLTLAQIKTLDCGSQRLADFPLQLTYPGTKISTLREVFSFVRCVDERRSISFNIESKIDAITPNATRSVDDFVNAQHAEFISSGYPLSQLTYQSFDWRTLIAMKKKDSRIVTSALISPDTAVVGPTGLSPWFAGIDLSSFPGADPGTRIAQAAKSIKANILSPSAGNLPALFVTKEMVSEAHRLGLRVAPWTVDVLGVAEQLIDWGVDGIISDYPLHVRRLAQQAGLSVPTGFSSEKVFKCLDRHLQRV